MNERTFRNLVRDMRAAQRAFFKALPQTPERQAALSESKTLEKRVDAEIAAGECGNLFAEEPAQAD